MPADRFRAYNASGDVVQTGDVPESGTVEFDAGVEVISEVVFYEGPEETEAVAGAVVVNHSGPVSASIGE